MSKRNDPGFDLLWRPAVRGARGPKPELTLDATVRAAIETADTGGLAALSMNRVARKLGVTPMALYRYVPSKEHLVDLMIDKALGLPPIPGRLRWRSAISQWAHAELARIQAHPWLLETVSTRTTVGPHWAAWLNAALGILSGLKLTAREKLALVLLIDGHVRSSAQISIGVGRSRQWAANLNRVLQFVAGDSRYAALSAIEAAGGFREPLRNERNAFQFGLDCIIRGVNNRGARLTAGGGPAKQRIR